MEKYFFLFHKYLFAESNWNENGEKTWLKLNISKP